MIKIVGHKLKSVDITGKHSVKMIVELELDNGEFVELLIPRIDLMKGEDGGFEFNNVVDTLRDNSCKYLSRLLSTTSKISFPSSYKRTIQQGEHNIYENMFQINHIKS